MALPASRRLAVSGLILLAALIAAAVPAVALEADAGPPNLRSSYIVVLDDGESPAEVAAAHVDRHGGHVRTRYRHAFRGYAADLTPDAAARIALDPRVVAVELDQPITIAGQAVPTGVDRIADPAVAGGLSPLAVDGLDDARVDADIAVLDTGVAGDHPDLHVVASVSCLPTCGPGGLDGHGHGTHVAGTAAALDNGVGAVGVAPGARIWAVKVLDDHGYGSMSWLAAGIDWVAARADRIEAANISLGCGCSSSAVTRALQALDFAGVTVAAAAGNYGQDAAGFFPANQPTVLTVSAVADFDGVSGGHGAATCRADIDDTGADFSNFGATVEIAAPGACIHSTVPGGGYGVMSGTSMAAPHVAGAAALLASTGAYRGRPAAIRETLLVGGNVDWTDESGDGVTEPLLDITGLTYATVATAPLPVVAVNDVWVTEPVGGQATEAVFTVTATPAPTGTHEVAVLATTKAGSAIAGQDFTAVTTPLRFSPGVDTQTVSVPILSDAAAEGVEKFTLDLTGADGAAVADATAIATIVDPAGPVWLSVDDGWAEEGQAARFTLSLSRPAAEPVFVQVATSAGTATSEVDFTGLPSTTLTFAAGETTRTVEVPTTADAAPEPDETFILTLAAAQGATVVDTKATGTIIGTGAPTGVAVADARVSEGDPARFTLSLTAPPPSGQTVSVKVTTADGTATAGSDYTALPSSTVTFAAGETTQVVTVAVAADSRPETNETFTLKLSSPVGVAIHDSQATATIVDRQGPIGIAVGNAWATEGGDAVFPISLTGPAPSGQPVSIKVTTANGSAVAGQDFTALATTTVVFSPGQSVRTVSVPTSADTAVEGVETFALVLSGAVGGVVHDSQGTASLLDPAGAIAVSVDDAWVSDPAAGATANLDFTVRLSAAPLTGQPVSVKVATSNGTAKAGSDFDARPLTAIHFAAGETSRRVTVTVRGDDGAEPDETLSLVLSGAAGAVVADNKGVGTIVDGAPASPPPPTFSVSDATTAEGGTAAFTVSLSAADSVTRTVQVKTANASAVAPADFTGLALTTLTFGPGVTSRTVTVPAAADTASEGNETFSLVLSSPTGATLADASGIGTILDAQGPIVASVTDAQTVEGNAVAVDLSLSAPPEPGQTASLQIRTKGGTAGPGADYSAVPLTTVSFGPGETRRTVSIPTATDSEREPDETIGIALSKGTGLVLADTTATATVIDDRGPLALTAADVQVVEGQSASVTLRLSDAPAAGQTVSVKIATSNGTAQAGSDYLAVASHTVIFASGQATRTVSIATVADERAEGPETFTLKLSSVVGAALSDPDAKVTIVDRGHLPGLSVTDAWVAEGGTAEFVLTLTAAPAAGQTVSVKAATVVGSAGAGDFAPLASTTVAFAPGQRQRTVSVPTLADAEGEGVETFTVTLASPVGLIVQDTAATASIVDPDGPIGIGVGEAGVVEGDAGATSLEFTVALSRAVPAGSTVRVTVSTADVTAAAGADYAALTPTVLTLTPGQRTATIAVTVYGDTAVERNEGMRLVLTAPQGAALEDSAATGTIYGDD